MKHLILTFITLLFVSLFYQANITIKAKTTSNFLPETSYQTELFPVKQNGKWGYINKLGQIIIKANYLAAQPFSEDIAFVRTSKHLKAIDSLGNTIFKLPLNSNFPGAYSEGLAPFLVDGKYGFIDKTGKTVIDFQFDFARSFSDGLAAVRFKKTDLLSAFISKKGEISFYIPSELTKGFVKKNISEITSLELTGKSDQPSASNLSLGFNGRIAFDTRAFSENLVSVKINNQYGYINKDGKVVIEPQFSYADAFSEGLAQVSLRGKCAFINQSGTIVINTPYHYYSCSSFSSGLAKIQIGRQIGYIDSNGQFIWPLTD